MLLYATVLVQCPVDGTVVRDDIDLTSGLRTSGQLLEIVHIGTLFFRHIVDMREVGIEGGTQTVVAEEECQHHDGSHEPALVFQTYVAEPRQQRVATALTTLCQLWQPEQHEEDCSCQQEGTEESKVAQSGTLQGHQREEGPHGGDITYHQRLHDFP